MLDEEVLQTGLIGLGEDDLEWAQICSICETTAGTEWYIVEYESDAYPPLEAVDRCLKGLRAMGK